MRLSPRFDITDNMLQRVLVADCLMVMIEYVVQAAEPDRSCELVEQKVLERRRDNAYLASHDRHRKCFWTVSSDC